MFFSILQSLIVLAYEYDNIDFGVGTQADPVRYKDFRDHLNYIKKVSCPTAAFTVTIGSQSRNSQNTILESDGVTANNPLHAKVGDLASIATQGAGNSVASGSYTLDRYDWQVTFRADDSSSYVQKENSSSVFSNKSFTFDRPGTYNFYLNVRDSMPHAITEGWGNWAMNGVHESIGRNPGPTGDPTDDLYGYWYYAQVQVIVKYPTLVENHIDRTTGKSLYQVVHRDITTNTKETQIKAFPGYKFTASKEGYTWEELDDCPYGTQTTRTAHFNTEQMNAFHSYYYEPLLGLFPNFAIKHNGANFTDKELTVQNLPVTVNLEDLSVGDNITNWTWEYKTSDTPSFQVFSTIQNPTKELDAEKTYTFRLTVKNAAEQKSIEHYIIVKKGTPPPPPVTGKPPVAVITGPSERMAGVSIPFSGGSSFDPDGVIVEYIWSIPGANITYTGNGDRNITAWYPEPGEYDLFLTVVDNDGMTGECMTSIRILPPVPTAAIDITGKLKENRKVTVSGSNSSSPAYYPINKYTWTMTNGTDARYTGTFGSDTSKDMILKKAQSYRFDLRVDNTYGLSDTETKTMAIVPDAAPVADFTMPKQVLRNKNDGGNATITVTNLSKSTDGDTIKKTVVFYAYDSNNDGNFDNETWYYSKDGTTWTASGLTYAQLNGLDLYNLAGAGNPANFILKTKNVGKYKFEAKTIEDIPAADTIPSLLSAADYRTGITTTSKLLSDKIAEVINTAPTVSFEVKKTKPADIFIFTDYTGTKLNGLNSVITAKKAQLNAIGVDPNFVIVNTSKTIGTQTMNKYRYVRYLHFDVKVTGGDGTNQQWTPSNPKYIDAGGFWEQKDSYEKPLNEIPFGRNYSWYQFTGITTRTSPYEATTRNYKVYDTAGGYEEVSFSTYYNYMGYYYNYSNWSITGVYPDAQWIPENFLGTDNLNAASIDIDTIKTAPLRTGSDRYAIFLSDGKSKDYSLGFGNSFAFGALTSDLKNYINQNNFKVYTIADPKAMNTLISKEVVIDMQTCENRISSNVYALAFFQSSNGYYYFFNGNTNKPCIVDSSVFGEVKSIISPGLILMKNGTAKRFDGSSFYSFPVNNIVSAEPVNGSQYYAVSTTGSIVICDSYNNMSIKLTIPATNYVTSFTGYSEYNGNYMPYSVVFTKNNVYVINLDTMSIIRNFAVNNFISYTEMYNDYIAFADSDSVDVLNLNTMNLSRTFNISGIAQLSYFTSWPEGENYRYGVYVVTNAGRVYRIADTNNDYLLDVLTNTPASFNAYNIKKIIEHMSGADLYMLTHDEKLVAYNSQNNSVYVSEPYYSIKQESINTSGYATIGNYSYSRPSGHTKLFLHNDGTVKACYPVVVGRHWSKKEEDYINDYALRTYAVSMPAGISAKKVSASALGMFILGTDNNLYGVLYTPQYQGDQSPSLSLFMSGVTDISDGYVHRSPAYGSSVYITRTDGSVVRRYTNNWNTYGVQIYTGTKYNVKKFNAVNNECFYLHKDGTASGTFSSDLINNNVTMTNPSAGYITMNELISGNPSSMTYGAGQYTQALDHLVSRYTADPSYTSNYILLGDTVVYNVQYSDTENDPKYKEYWKYNHNPYYFDNSIGTLSVNGQTLNYPVAAFDKTGKVDIDLKIRDNPKNDDRFDNYRLPNAGIVNAALYVHRKPTALQRITIADNGNGTFTVKSFDAGSYDLDHTSRSDKGIAAREWRWKESLQPGWTAGQMNKPDCTPDKAYITQLRVKDLEGVWSDYNTIELDDDNPPVALFNIDNLVIKTTEKLKVKDQSFPQSFSTITNWHWVVKKLNTDGSAPAANLQSTVFTSSNNGTGAMAGFDVNVMTEYSGSGTGRYRVYLRVKNSHGLWSDGGTDAVSNLNSFYSQDFEADRLPTASFTIDKNIIKVDEVLKVKDQSTAPGTSPLAKWQWIVKKLAADGSVPGSNIQNEQFTDRNTGTGAMAGYDVNVKIDCSSNGAGTYRIYLRVMNGNRMWSDGGTEGTINLGSCAYRDLAVDSPPIASFVIDKNPIEPAELLKIRDTSTITGVSPINRWHWIVKKLNANGTVPGTSLRDLQFTNSNAGTGELAGYDANVKTDYSSDGVGTYRIYLRVRNSNNMWSDGGTDNIINLDNFFSQDLIVRESHKLSNFRVTRIKDIHLETYYYDSVAGQYIERLTDVNGMAIDYQNFNGMIDGLTKGYIFEFAIDSANFNDEADTIRITPRFYTCDDYSRDSEERALYWENSHHEVLKAGEGGHAPWASIELARGDRTITAGNNATWRGSYLIPGTAWAVPQGTPAADSKGRKINRDIIVSFEIRGYKNGELKYDYNLQQWPEERTFEKYPYEIGDVIRYSHSKSNLEDKNVIINRP